MDPIWIAIGAGVVAVVLLLWAFTRTKKPADAPSAATRKPDEPAAKDAGAKDSGAKPAAKDAGAKDSGAKPAAKDAESAKPSAAAPTSTSKPASGSRALAGVDSDDAEEGTTVGSVRPPAAPVPVQVSISDGVDLSKDDDDPSRRAAMVLVSAHGRTDAGRHRKHNEDSYLVMADTSSFVIADGMGGYAAGEVASGLAIETLKQALETSVFAGEPTPKLPRRGDELVRGIQMANDAIYLQARANESQQRMGTTIVGCRFSPNRERIYIAHVGDSRCYRIRDGLIEQMTTDHTLGAIGIVGPSANKLSRAVGVGKEIEVDVRIDGPRVGDRYLLCSDGLSRMVPDEMIRAIVLEAPDLQAAVDKLVATANERGGRDNITVILVELHAPGTVQPNANPASSKTTDRPRPRPAASAQPVRPAKR